MKYRLNEETAQQSHWSDSTPWLRRFDRSLPPLAVFVLALVVRVAFILTLEERLYWPDELEFDKIAVSLLNGEGYEAGPFRGNPILPLFLSFVYKLFGYSYIEARIVQSVLGAFTACIIFALSREVFDTRVAFLAGVIVAVYPPLIYISGMFYVSALETFLLAGSVYLLFIGKQRNSPLLLLASGVAIGITILCRPASLMLLPFAVVFVLHSHDGRPARRTTCALALLTAAIVTILPWTLSNYREYGRVVLVSTGSGEFLWKGNNELAKGNTFDRYLQPGAGDVWLSRLAQLEPDRRDALTRKYDLVRHDLESLDEIDRDRYLQKLGLIFITERPDQFLPLVIRKIGTLYTAFTEVRDQHEHLVSQQIRVAFSFVFYPLLVLALFGLLTTLQKWRNYLVLYIPIASLTCAYALLASASRFRIPLDPFIIIFASHGALILWNRFHASGHSGKRRPAALLCC